MSACYIRQLKWDKAIYAASKALALAPENLKALYRRAEAYLEMGRNQLAAKDIDLALDLRPNGEFFEHGAHTGRPWCMLACSVLTFKTPFFQTDPVIRKLGERLVQAFEDEERDKELDRAPNSST